MGKASTKAQNKYIAKAYDRVNLTMQKGRKEEIQIHAAQLDQMLHFLGIVDGPILDSNIPLMGLLDQRFLIQRDIDAKIILCGDLEAGKIGGRQQIHPENMGNNEISCRTGGTSDPECGGCPDSFRSGGRCIQRYPVQSA